MTAYPAIICIALLILSPTADAQSLNQVVQCTTPSGDFGSCILLESCQSLIRLVSSGGSSVEVLRKSQCGFIGTKPKVCCANNPNPIIFREPNATTAPAKTAREPAPVSIQPTEPVRFPSAAEFISTLPQPSEQATYSSSPNGGSSSNQFISPTNNQNGLPSEIITGDNESNGVQGVSAFTPLPANNDGGSQQTNLRGDQLPGTNTCGSVTITNKIYGGKNTSIEDFPWMALLKYRTAKSEEHYGCGGVLINHRYVLTAAHCVKTPSKHTLVQVRLGEWNLETDIDCVTPPECNAPPLDVDIEETVHHEHFDSRNLTNDIALIRLKKDVTYTDWVQPICLPGNENRDFTDETFWVAGWGQTESGIPSPVKLKLEIRHVELETCRVAYRRLHIALGNGTMCAGGRLGQDTCAGDSGGPLMKLIPSGSSANYYTVGIVSLGPSRCGIEGWAGVYTKVSHYSDWIKSNLKP